MDRALAVESGLHIHAALQRICLDFVHLLAARHEEIEGLYCQIIDSPFGELEDRLVVPQVLPSNFPQQENKRYGLSCGEVLNRAYADDAVQGRSDPGGGHLAQDLTDEDRQPVSQRLSDGVPERVRFEAQEPGGGFRITLKDARQPLAGDDALLLRKIPWRERTREVHEPLPTHTRSAWADPPVCRRLWPAPTGKAHRYG